MFEINSNDGSHVQGFMQIELYNKESGISRIKRYNTVTNIGKQFMLAKSASPMIMGFGGSPYGRIAAIDTLGGIYYTTNYGTTYRYAQQDIGLNNYLVNIPDTLTVDSKYLNIFDNNLDVDPTKLVGFANNNITSADSREGIQDFCKGIHMVNKGAVANRWKYAEGVATGTFNYVAMAPGIHGRLKANGFYNKKCISRVNILDAGNVINNAFIMPGAVGLTGVNDVILNYTNGGVSRWRYNLVTGETVAVENTEPAFTAPMYEQAFGQVYIDGYLYVLNNKGRLYKINTTTGEEENSLNNAASYVSCGASMYYDGTNIVVCDSYNSNEGKYDARAVVKIINKDTLGVVSSVNKVEWEGLGGVPFGWSRNRLLVKKAGAYYYVSHFFETIKCTDLSNIKGTTVGMYLASPYVNYVNNGTDTWMFDSGINYPAYNYILGEPTLSQAIDDSLDTINNNNTEFRKNYASTGVWISKEDCGNLISFVKLEPAIVKAPTDIMYVSYGYEFV